MRRRHVDRVRHAGPGHRLQPGAAPLRGLFTPDRRLPEGVHAFRTLDDCLGLAEAVRPGTRAVVIGGGLLGVSAARALAVRGAQVVLAQQAERLMERQLDPDASRLVLRHLTDLGVEVHTECRVRDVRCVAGAVRSVELADGYALDADLVVLACGVRPRTGLAEQAGLTVRKGVLVDDELRTSDPHIHAIGDCAQHDGTVYGLAAPALEQAEALAELLAGDTSARYRGTRSLTRLTLTGPGSPSTSPRSARPRRAPATTSCGSPTPPGAPTARSSSATTAWSAGSSSANSAPSARSPGPGRSGTAPRRRALLHLLTNDGGS